MVAAVVQGQALSEEVAAVELEDCPIRMVSHPSGRLLVLALGGGGLCRVDLTVPEHGGAPVLARATGVACAAHAPTHGSPAVSSASVTVQQRSAVRLSLIISSQPRRSWEGERDSCNGVAWAKILTNMGAVACKSDRVSNWLGISSINSSCLARNIPAVCD